MTTTRKPRWGLTFHLEQEVRPDVWKPFDAYPTRSRAVAAGRKLVTGRWRVVEVASRVIWVHEPERRKPTLKSLRLGIEPEPEPAKPATARRTKSA